MPALAHQRPVAGQVVSLNRILQVAQLRAGRQIPPRCAAHRAHYAPSPPVPPARRAYSRQSDDAAAALPSA